MGFDIDIPGDFGYIAIVAALASLQHVWMWYEVIRARARYKVHAPKVFLTEDEDNALAFNCVQRAFQNNAENLPVFFTLLLLGGLQHPRLNAVAALFYVIPRFIYYFGYTSGDPSKRTSLFAMFWVASLFFMCATTMSFGIQSLYLKD